MPSLSPNLVSLRSPRPCPVCDSTGPRTMLHQQHFLEGPLGEGYDVVVCNRCGAGFADGIPSQEELDRYYAERSKYTYAHNNGAESPFDLKRFEKIADQIELHLPDRAARILDIGCATGGLLAELKKRGYRNLVGSDPSPACTVAARRIYDLDARVASLREHEAWPERFDAVLLVGVLEHLRDVVPLVRIAGKLLTSNGLLYCAQPDVEAFATCENAPYQQFSVEHMNFFSAASLSCLMAAVELVPRQTWRWMVEWREGMTDSVVSAIFARCSDIRSPLPGNSGPKSIFDPLSSVISPPPSVLVFPASANSSPTSDQVTTHALQRYLVASAQQEAGICRRIDELVCSQEPLLVWGAGTLTRHLLATTSLARTNIIAFVDSNPQVCQYRLAGRAIFAPQEILGREETIIICSKPFEREIIVTIRERLGLSNRLILLP